MTGHRRLRDVDWSESPPIQLYDTTCRDGTQGEGISLSVDDKLKITCLLDELGVGYVEGGWPGSNPKDADFFERVKRQHLSHARIAAFGCTCRVGSTPEEDSNIQALLSAETPVVTVVGKSSELHAREVLRATLEENLDVIRESLAYLKGHGREVVYDAEHFFDGYKADARYALSTLRAAMEGGADTLVLCDTNGGSLPWEVEAISRKIRSEFPQTTLGMHAHNDGGLAVANTLAAVRAGVTQVQGTINGYGERCGNADLCALVPNLQVKMGRPVLPDGRLPTLTRLAAAVAGIVNQPLGHQAPYVGRSAFTHKAGMHVAAMRRNSHSYQHLDPTLVGNRSRVVVSELSGRGNLQSKVEELGMDDMDQGQLPEVVRQVKELEHRGFSFEGADASVETLLRRARAEYRPRFEMLDFMVVVEHRKGQGVFAQATIKVRVKDEIFHSAADGKGPVNALDRALRKALLPVYPELAAFDLADYKVHILNGERGTGATTRVLVDMQNESHRWTTVGASPNIIEASWIALADAVEYGLAKRWSD
jgi:2-isopropylmalate synthase